MMKQKMKILFVVAMALFMVNVFAKSALANGGATVSWVAPTTNEDASTPVDVTGYRVFYSTSAIDCATWDAANQTARQTTPLVATYRDVTEAAALRDSGNATKRGYTFNTTTYLTPGQTYNFAVVAFDGSGNMSQCAVDASSNKTVSKMIYRAGNFKNSGVVGLSDLSVLAGDFGRTSWCRIASHPSDINGDCTVSLSDLSIFASEYGQ